MVRGIAKVKLILHSRGKAVPVTQDELVVVPGCRFDLFRFKA